MTGLVFEPAHWAGYAAASAMIALTYAFMGMLVAPLVGRIGAVLLAFLIPFLDLGLSQSPMLRAEPEGWARLLPGYGGMRLLVDAAITQDFDQWTSLWVAVAWLMTLAVVGVAAVTAPLGRRSRSARSARLDA
jgi:hypothetical protein